MLNITYRLSMDKDNISVYQTDRVIRTCHNVKVKILVSFSFIK